jgi:rhodanese-related sulfurtransferase
LEIQDFTPIIFIAVTLIGFHFLRQRMMGAVVTPEELVEKMKTNDVKIIDVRSEGEFAGDLGHIEGAVNIPVGNLAEEILGLGKASEQQKNEMIVTICRTHNRSPRAARMLKDVGFKNVVVLKGGMMAWNSKKLPVEK